MSNVLKIAQLPVLVALVASCGMAQAVNLLTNGSFENLRAGSSVTAPVANDYVSLKSFDSSFDAIDGWTVSFDTLAWIGSPLLVPSGNLIAHEGNRFLDLTDTSFANPYGGITTTVNTIVGTTYMLSYWLGTDGAFNQSNGGVAAVVSITGAGPLTASSTQSFNANSWEQFTRTFTAVSATTSITILGIAGADYIGLDEVSVSVVPEPMGIALALAGMGIVGVGMGKRRPAA